MIGTQNSFSKIVLFIIVVIVLSSSVVIVTVMLLMVTVVISPFEDIDTIMNKLSQPVESSIHCVSDKPVELVRHRFSRNGCKNNFFEKIRQNSQNVL